MALRLPLAFASYIILTANPQRGLGGFMLSLATRAEVDTRADLRYRYASWLG
jgi:hypothetical protein